MKQTHLIARSNPDDLKKKKDEIIKNETNKRQLIKWSDTAVETRTKLFIFKVVSLPRNLLDQIKGYDFVDAEPLLEDLDKFVSEIGVVCGKIDKSDTKTSPEAPDATEKKDTKETKDSSSKQ